MDKDRIGRVCELIKRELAQLIQREVKDPRLPPMVTVTEVTVTRDLAHAKVYVSLLVNDDKQDLLISILSKAAGYLRSALAKRVKLRTVPALHFVYDNLGSTSQRLNQLIDEAIHNDQNSQGEDE